jgi:hypothetical protein
MTSSIAQAYHHIIMTLEPTGAKHPKPAATTPAPAAVEKNTKSVASTKIFNEPTSH